MRSLFISVFLQLAVLVSIAAPHTTKHSNGLLTPSFGIVTEDDLAFDHHSIETVPYDPNKDSGSLYWQCFPLNETEAKYRTWKVVDERGRWVNRCSPEVYIHHNGELQQYVDRRGHPIGHCKEFIEVWRNLTQAQTAVCLNGEGGFYSKDIDFGKYKLWTWTKVKTKRGCYSYFEGDCETDGCSKGKCRGRG